MTVIHRAGCISLLVGAIFLAASGCHHSARRFVYVFSPEAAFVKIASDTLSVMGQGNLRSEATAEVDGVIDDPDRRDIFLETAGAWSATASGPTEGIVVLRATTEKQERSLLRLVRTIAPPAGTSLTGAIVAKDPHRMIVTSWSGDERGSSEVTLAMAEDNQFHEPMKIEDFSVGTGTCATSDGSRLLSFSAAEPAAIRVLALADMTVRKAPISGGALTVRSPRLVGGRSAGCRVLLVGRSPGSSDDRRRIPARVFDLEQLAMVGELDLGVPGQYFLADSGALVLVDERTLVPNVLPNGQTVGMRYKKLGRLHVLEAATGKEVSLLKLPEDGALAASDGSTGYYLSPGSLSVLDLKAGTIRATVKVPFSSGFVALNSER
ncbi:MAG: hypothetical protein ACLQME_07860 [Alphaproteobacteria bacterium]